MFLVAALLLFVFIRSAKKYKGGKPVAPSGIAKWTDVNKLMELAKQDKHRNKLLAQIWRKWTV